MSVPNFIRAKVIDPLVRLLKQGVTPESMAWSLAAGVVIGVIPVLGTTTALCTIIALGLRLNLPAIQLTNWLVYPLQIALLIPFFHLGETLFHAEHTNWNPTELVALFKDDFLGAIQTLWWTTVHAVAAWIITGLPALVLLYALLKPILRRLPLPREEATAS